MIEGYTLSHPICSSLTRYSQHKQTGCSYFPACIDPPPPADFMTLICLFFFFCAVVFLSVCVLIIFPTSFLLKSSFLFIVVFFICEGAYHRGLCVLMWNSFVCRGPAVGPVPSYPLTLMSFLTFVFVSPLPFSITLLQDGGTRGRRSAMEADLKMKK